jgi:hypothetical protein
MGLFALVHDGAALLLIGMWLGPALWTYTDAQQRFADAERPARLLVAAVVLPLATPLLYALLRPTETLVERRARELKCRLLEETLSPAERCLVCRTPVEADFLRCPGCAAELRRPCPECRAPLRLHWSACPYCAAELAPESRRLPLVA